VGVQPPRERLSWTHESAEEKKTHISAGQKTAIVHRRTGFQLQGPRGSRKKGEEAPKGNQCPTHWLGKKGITLLLGGKGRMEVGPRLVLIWDEKVH